MPLPPRSWIVATNNNKTMNTINQDELYGHVREFLKAKGVELQDGAYTRRIQKGCGILAKTINGSREMLERARTEADRRLDQVRQVIHEKTAPRKPAEPPPAPAEPATAEPATENSKPLGKAKPARRKPQPRTAKAVKKRK